MSDALFNDFQLYLETAQVESINEELKLLGVGCDICRVGRLEYLYEKWGEKIGVRILSPQEMSIWITKKKSIHFLAKRWAGNKAVVKALGLGFRKGLRWREISILNDKNGKPFVQFTGQTKQLLVSDKQQVKCYISLADEEMQALAYCVAFISITPQPSG
ncbi:MAG TPA: holo-[acyl-carrier-protein] synthase [Gammaproteobacteria bacterium]|nr:holo-[acyl-carrier-protein] synthase [Gammaproteobacteria bacterium]